MFIHATCLFLLLTNANMYCGCESSRRILGDDSKLARRIHGNTLNIITPRNHVFLDYDYHHLGQIGTNEANLKIFCDLKKAVKTYLTCNIYFQNLLILGYVCFEQKKKYFQ